MIEHNGVSDEVANMGVLIVVRKKQENEAEIMENYWKIKRF